MAAPTIPSSLKKANLSALLSRDNKPKVTSKNILCPVFQEWPRVPKEVEETILAKLTEKLMSVVNVFKPTKKPSTEEKPQKVRVRSQLEIGASCVFRALERDTLACILVSGQATPAIAIDHIISLGQERGCPLLCLDQLASAVASATKSKCLPLAIGFKKMENNSCSDFSEVISLVKENVRVQSPCIKHLNMSIDVSNKESTARTKTNKNIPIRINPNMEREILEDLKRIFSEALVATVDKNKQVKKKKKQKKKNLKDVFDKTYHCQFDIGKRTVSGILERGKLEIIMVTEQILPVLTSETEAYSLLSIAAVKKCPVLVLPGLTDIMKSLCGGMVSVLGLKKLDSLQVGHKNFQSVIDKCLLAVNKPQPECVENMSNMETMASKEAVGLSPFQDNKDQPATIIDNDKTKGDKDIEKVSSKLEPESEEEDDEEEDYSYLYIMKKDSKELAEVKHELSSVVENTNIMSFSSDYISLSSSSGKSDLKTSKSFGEHKTNKSTSDMNVFKESKVSDSNLVEAEHFVEESSSKCTGNFNIHSKLSNSGRQNASPGMDSLENHAGGGSRSSSHDKVNEAPLFSVCRSGDNINSKSNIKVQNKKQFSSNKHKDEVTLGMKELAQSEDKTKSIDYLAFEVSSKSGKKALKRKLQNNDSFISFAYTESNIRTMTSNPSKKKNKKKKKNKA